MVATQNRMAQTIRRAFERSGLSIKALSVRAGIPYASAHGFVKNGRNLTLDTTAKICELLGLELRPARQEKRIGATWREFSNNATPKRLTTADG